MPHYGCNDQQIAQHSSHHDRNHNGRLQHEEHSVHPLVIRQPWFSLPRAGSIGHRSCTCARYSHCVVVGHDYIRSRGTDHCFSFRWTGGHRLNYNSIVVCTAISNCRFTHLLRIIGKVVAHKTVHNSHQMVISLCHTLLAFVFYQSQFTTHFLQLLNIMGLIFILNLHNSCNKF